MSTPSGARFERIDNRNRQLRAENENSIEPSEEKDDPALSAYAPKRSGRMHTVPRAEESDASEVDMPRFVLGGERSGAGLGESRPAASSEDHLLRLDDQSKVNPGEGRGEPDWGERAPDSGDDQSVAPNNEIAATAAADRSQAPSTSEPVAGLTERSEGSGAADIERLEASLRWLKNQSAELRRSSPDPLVLPRVLPRAAWQLADSASDGIGVRPRSVEPEKLVPPALLRAQDRKRAPLLTVVAILIAAPIAYFGVGKSDLWHEKPQQITLASAPQPIAFRPAGAPQGEPKPTAVEPPPIIELPVAPQMKITPNQSRDPRASSADGTSVSLTTGLGNTEATSSSVNPSTPSALIRSQDEIDAGLRASPADAQQSAAHPPLRRLDPAEIQLLMKRGERYIADGDPAAARVVLQRAAEAGDANAALAMGATYDPLILKVTGVLGVPPDPGKARSWYERAKGLGSQEAWRRLDLLANR
jgi:hypothetical protein